MKLARGAVPPLPRNAMKAALTVLVLTAALAACGEPEGPVNTAADEPAQTPTAAAPTTDAELNSKIKQELVATNDLHAEQIEVTSADGVVTLYGTVNEPAEKERAALLVV